MNGHSAQQKECGLICFDMKEKIMEGKLSSYFKDQILMEQDFIKNPDTTIGEMVTGAVQKFGENVSIAQISRLSIK